VYFLLVVVLLLFHFVHLPAIILVLFARTHAPSLPSSPAPRHSVIGSVFLNTPHTAGEVQGEAHASIIIHTTSYHTTSHHITSHHTHTPHRITSHHITSHTLTFFCSPSQAGRARPHVPARRGLTNREGFWLAMSADIKVREITISRIADLVRVGEQSTTSRRRAGKEGPCPGGSAHKHTTTMYASSRIATAPVTRK